MKFAILGAGGVGGYYGGLLAKHGHDVCVVARTSNLSAAKFDFDVVGHYSRPDIFRLMVDDQPKPPVETVSSKSKPSTRSE